MSSARNSKQNDHFAQMAQQLRRNSGGSPAAYRDAPPPRRRTGYDMSNTIGPNEELTERRRKRKHVAVDAAAGNRSVKQLLGENIFLLILLVGSLYGVYRLALHVLNQV